MRIISQDRCHSLDFYNISVSIDDNFIVADKYTPNRIILGEYETEKRAEEVFKDIHSAYNPIAIVAQGLDEEQIKAFIGSENMDAKVAIMPDRGDWMINNHGTGIYYMPKQ